MSTIRPEDLSRLLDLPLTDEQLAAATGPAEPGVVIAGAGSGKTTVMAARVVWLVMSGAVRPDEVLGLTFTNKAAAELSHRVRQALQRAGVDRSRPATAEDPGDPGEPTVLTYHAYAGRLLREHGLRIGVEPQARLLADATRFQVAERVLRRSRGPFPDLDKGVRALVGDVVGLDGELAEHLAGLDDARAEDAAIRAEIASAPKQLAPLKEAAAASRKRDQLLDLVEAVREEKARLAALDFGDQIALAARLAEEHPSVGGAERDRFRVVLLDEYQDTSYAQKVLLRALFGSGHPVTAVGDPFQAIYGWRGASVANIEAFPTDFARADGSPATTYGLTQNNRSGGRLLDLANDLAAPLREQHAGVRPLVPRPGAEAEGSARVGLFASSVEECAWVADGIAAEIRGGRPPGDIAVLVRVRSDFPAYHEALVARGVPVEVVGLGGLLALPEVVDLVCMLTVLDDPTANAALVRVLSGPRWRIGPRDLVLLGRRAADLVRGPRDHSEQVEDVDHDVAQVDALPVVAEEVPGPEVEDLLDEAVAGVDPADVVSLAEALADLGPGPYSPEARVRLTAAAGQLRELRRHLGEPLLDLLHRVLRTTGLDVEVGAAPTGPRTRRSEALAAFLEHAADFADLDGDMTVRAFLAFLTAADTFDRGLDTTAPTAADSVKLMTVHKAKGLEWPVVVLPDLTADVFPAKRGRPRWTKAAATLPTVLRGDADDYPVVEEWTTSGLTAFNEAMRELDLLEERRLGYVAVTRAKDLVVASSHWWGPTQKKPRGPSPYLLTMRAHCEAGGGTVVGWADEPEPDAVNPALAAEDSLRWPVPLAAEGVAARREAATYVLEALATDGAATPAEPDDGAALADLGAETVEGWDRDLEALLEEARLAHQVDLAVRVPRAMSASALVRLAADPDGLARDLARPMPRRPAAAASRGTRFHAWVEGLFGQRPLLDRAELGGAADEDLVDAEDLAGLRAAFLAGPFATTPPHRVEAPFQLLLGGRVVRGRIDAVYARAEGGYDVVDWKTGGSSADPLQLAVYRAAWAQIAGVPESEVGAAFYYVARGEVVRPDDLPGAEALEALLTADPLS